MTKAAVIIPVFGRRELTHNLLIDINRERALVDAIVVDNGGDYQQFDDEQVIRLPTNLGWLGGCNAGLRSLGDGYDVLILMNNDTRLSHDFFCGLLRCARNHRVGLAGPSYDDPSVGHQRSDYTGPADQYSPRRRQRSVPYLDGTCLAIPRNMIRRIGYLDEIHFGSTGWGADIEYAVRVRRAGYDVRVTEQAFLNHLKGSTAIAEHRSYDAYWEAGHRDMITGLHEVLGPNYSRVAGLDGSRSRWALERARHRVRQILRTPRSAYPGGLPPYDEGPGQPLGKA